MFRPLLMPVFNCSINIEGINISSLRVSTVLVLHVFVLVFVSIKGLV